MNTLIVFKYRRYNIKNIALTNILAVPHVRKNYYQAEITRRLITIVNVLMCDTKINNYNLIDLEILPIIPAGGMMQFFSENQVMRKSHSYNGFLICPLVLQCLWLCMFTLWNLQCTLMVSAILGRCNK